MNNSAVKDFLKEEYGISGETMSEDEKDKWIKDNVGSAVKLNAALHELPSWILKAEQQDKYSDVYRVVYDKGIGQLQRSAKNKDLLRANIVEYGTNNKVVGQAELQAVTVDKATQLSNAALSVFQVASVVTNQYFLSRIDSKLSSIEKVTNDIKRFLELDKETELLAEYDFISKEIENIQYILSDEGYRYSVLTKIQDIKIKALQNIRFYKAKLNDEKENLNVKDSKSETNEKLNGLSNQFSELWLSVNLYSLSSYLEVRLSGVTDEKYLDKTVDDVLDKILDYKDLYDKHYEDLQKYVKYLDRFKPNQIITIVRSLSWLLDLSGWYGDMARQVVQAGADVLAERDKQQKENDKKNALILLENYLNPYSDIDTLEEGVKEILYLELLYSEKVEIISNNESAYIYMPDADNMAETKFDQMKASVSNKKIMKKLGSF